MQGKRDMHAYAQQIRHIENSTTANPVNEHTLITIFMQGLADNFVKTYLLHVELDTLE